MGVTMIDTFIETRLHRDPHGRMRLQAFVEMFRTTLTPRQLREWPRQRIVGELQQRFPLGKGPDRRTYIGGLSTDPPARWATTEGGKLVLCTS